MSFTFKDMLKHQAEHVHCDTSYFGQAATYKETSQAEAVNVTINFEIDKDASGISQERTETSYRAFVDVPKSQVATVKINSVFTIEAAEWISKRIIGEDFAMTTVLIEQRKRINPVPGAQREEM